MESGYEESTMKNRTRDFEDDDDKILQDGHVLRVPMTQRDSLSPLQRAVADNAVRDNNRITDEAYARGRSFESTGFGSHGPRGQQAGDVCMTNDKREGRLRMVKGQLVCVAVKQDAKPVITDGRTTDPMALHHPGFRVPVVNDRHEVHRAYAADAAYLRNRYKCGDGERLCEDCNGEGYDEDGNVCSTCNGDGVMPEAKDQRKSRVGSNNMPDPASDSRTLDQHRQVMDQAYQSYDNDLENAWRGR
jgi:hypothetical protein